MFYVYILYSKSLDKYYKGYTKNLRKRFKEHNQGKGSYTSTGIPWSLVLYLLKPSKKEAIELEQKLKNLNRKRLETFIKKYKV